MEQITLGDLVISVELKDIKNVHLRVYPPDGRVRIAAPLRMSVDNIRVYAISRLTWIKKQQAKFLAQKREAPREYLNREGHYFLGDRYLMKVVERDAPPQVNIKQKTLELFHRPNTSTSKRKAILDDWYRVQLRAVAAPLVGKWESRMGVTLNEFGIKKMRTKWGTCNREAKRIWLNLELAKKPIHCIEYIIVHEMVHLLERNHNDRFIAYINHFLPEWRDLKSELNRLTISHMDC